MRAYNRKVRITFRESSNHNWLSVFGKNIRIIDNSKILQWVRHDHNNQMTIFTEHLTPGDYTNVETRMSMHKISRNMILLALWKK
jgi:hypothetical protein